jgi:hypothetical protein
MRLRAPGRERNWLEICALQHCRVPSLAFATYLISERVFTPVTPSIPA